MRSSLLAVVAGAAIAAPALADYKAIGAFNGWDNGTSVLMSDLGGGVWGANIPATPGVSNAFKVNIGTWDSSWPTSGNTTAVPTGSSIDVRFYDNDTPNDGWSPNSKRVGYVDQGGTGWELMGSVNGWSTPFGTLTSLGGGNYKGSVFIPVPGSYEFKFRSIAAGWSANVGASGGDGDNASFTTAAPSLVTFHLDVEGGRWKIDVPAPSSLALLGVGALVAGRRRR